MANTTLPAKTTTINYPEMWGTTSDNIQAEYSGITDRYIIRSLNEITIKRGIKYNGVISKTGANNMPNKLAGWHKYYMTPKAFSIFEKQNQVILNLLLD